MLYLPNPTIRQLRFSASSYSMTCVQRNGTLSLIAAAVIQAAYTLDPSGGSRELDSAIEGGGDLAIELPHGFESKPCIAKICVWNILEPSFI